MSSDKSISHRGRIIEITPEVTRVEIISESACGACRAKGLCSLAESKKKVIELRTSGWDTWKVGDEVDIQLKASMGHKAVWVAYMIPLFILVIVLSTLSSFGIPELYSGLGAIAAVALYYLFIWLFRSKLRNEYIFNIKQ